MVLLPPPLWLQGCPKPYSLAPGWMPCPTTIMLLSFYTNLVSHVVRSGPEKQDPMGKLLPSSPEEGVGRKTWLWGPPEME